MPFRFIRTLPLRATAAATAACFALAAVPLGAQAAGELLIGSRAGILAGPVAENLDSSLQIAALIQGQQAPLIAVLTNVSATTEVEITGEPTFAKWNTEADASGDFSVLGTVAGTLAPGVTRTISVQFQPQAVGRRYAVMTIPTNASNASGEGVQALVGGVSYASPETFPAVPDLRLSLERAPQVQVDANRNRTVINLQVSVANYYLKARKVRLEVFDAERPPVNIPTGQQPIAARRIGTISGYDANTGDPAVKALRLRLVAKNRRLASSGYLVLRAVASAPPQDDVYRGDNAAGSAYGTD